MTIQKPPSQPECEWVEECIESCDATSVYVVERGVGATFLNSRRKKIRKIHYDGCYNKTPGVKQADYIVGMPDVLDVIVELKGSDTNIKEAYFQVESTLEAWRVNPARYRKIVCLIVYGRIEGKKKLAGRVPRANSMKDSAERQFLGANKALLLVRESGSEQFNFNDFLRKTDAND
jgi:hypothetical protein